MDRSWWRVLTKHGPLGKGMANDFSILALRTPWRAQKGKKDMTQEDELPGLVGAQFATEEDGETATEGMKKLSQNKNNTQLWMCLVTEVKFTAVKSNTA